MSITSRYCVVRYVPDVIRDEGINIGVLLETGNNGDRRTLARFTENFQRAARLDPFLKGSALERTIKNAIDQIYHETDALDLNELVANYSGGKIQLTHPRATLVDDLEIELAELYEQFIVDDREERHHGKADPTLRKEVREILAARGINGERVRFSNSKEPIRVKGRKTRHSFDMSIQVNHHQDFIRCISFDVEHYLEKLDTTKALVYDARDIHAVDSGTGVLSILYPPKTHEEELPNTLFAEAQAILKDEKIPAFNFDSSEEIEELIERIKA